MGLLIMIRQIGRIRRIEEMEKKRRVALATRPLEDYFLRLAL